MVGVMTALGVSWGYGVGTSQGNLDELRDQARWAEGAGFDSLWVSQIFGLDPIVALAAIGSEFPAFTELGTSVVPLTGRHPMSLAPAALTAQAATGGRFTDSHPPYSSSLGWSVRCPGFEPSGSTIHKSSSPSAMEVNKI